jgi:hypothetical protein
VIIQDAAVTVFAIAGAAILVRKLTRAIRPKTAAACEHCPSGAAAVANRATRDSKQP